MSVTAIFPGSFKPPHKGHFSIVKQLLNNPKIGHIDIIVSRKGRSLLEGNKREISQAQSLYLWNAYLNLLRQEERAKVKVIASQDVSPILTTMSIVRRAKGSPIILIKSGKNAGNTRFETFKRYPGVSVMTLGTFGRMSSTDMRRAISEGDRLTFEKHLPMGISNTAAIWREISAGMKKK